MLVMDNYFEWEKDLLFLTEESRIWPTINHDLAMQQRLLLDRRIANLLSSFRIYIDQFHSNFSSLFGKSSREFAKAKLITNKLYDEYFSYRFIEALRNYVQHKGLPVHTINYGTQLRDTARLEYNETSITPIFSWQALEEAGSLDKFKQSIRTELMNLKNIDLRPTIRTYVQCIDTLHQGLRTILDPKLKTARDYYEKKLIEYEYLNNVKFNYVRVSKLGANNRQIDRVELTRNFLDYLDFIKSKNHVTKKLCSSYSTNMA